MSQSFNDLKFMKLLEVRNKAFHTIAVNVFDKAKIQLNYRVPALFPEYTQHDVEHSLRVIENIESIVYDIDMLNDFEILLIIVCALLHDAGMAVDAETVESIKTNKSNLTDIKFEAMLEKHSGDTALALQELIRLIHGDLSASMISNLYGKLFVLEEIGNLSFTDDVMTICKSHTKDHIWLDANLSKHLVKDKFEYNPLYLAILLRLGDILDFDARRTPLFLYNIIRPKGNSDKEWMQHFIVSNTEKVKPDRDSNLKKIVIHGRCTDVELHRKFLGYVDWINQEIDYAVESTKSMDPRHRLSFKTRVELNVESVGYTVSNYRLNVDFRSITNLLMGEKIYGERSLGIRELVQNSIDACKVRKEKEDQHKKFGDEPYLPVIKIIVNEEETSVIIRDNGCGMDEEIIKKYFLNIGKSYYTSDDYLLRRHNYKPIGNYGIGFLSCFMLSDRVIVRTSKPESKYRFDMVLERGSEYISFTRVEDTSTGGTEVELDYSSFSTVLAEDKTTIVDFLKKYFINESIKIIVIKRKEETEEEIRSFLDCFSARENYEQRIDCSPFVNDVRVFSIVRQKKVFIRCLADVPKIKDIIYYEDGELSKTSSLPLSEFINDEQIEYLNIPIYAEGQRDEFETALHLRDNDIDEVIERIEPEQWCSLVVGKGEQKYISEKDLQDGDNIIFPEIEDDLFLDFLKKTDYFIPKVFAKTEKLFGNASRTLFVPFEDNAFFGDRYLFIKRDMFRMYLRDILVKNHLFIAHSLPGVFELDRLNVNVLSQRVIPDVSRNKFDDKTAGAINYSVFKALVQTVAQELTWESDEKELLQQFISAKYGERSLLGN